MSKGLKKGAEGLVAVIADEDTITGFLLAGVGEITDKDGSNFFIVSKQKNTDSSSEIENAFKKFSGREDIGIILITQDSANKIRHILDEYNQTVPAVLEIPSKESHYDASKDYIMQRVKLLSGD